jgi:hypothetical protein
MSFSPVLYHMVRADFLERVRRYGFLVTLAGALWLAYGIAAEKIWIVVGDGYRGVYNSAWIGALMATCCSTFLSLAGFYIVKNCVQRDADTRVGQILAATPMRKDFYTLAKTLSNFVVLACMVMILMLAALAMQATRAEAHTFVLWRLWSPFVFIALPSMLLTGSLALLFETIPFLRGGFGNVAYFFLWTAIGALGATGFDDPTGLQLIYRSTRRALIATDPSAADHFNFSLTIGGEHAVKTFWWNGIDWTPQVLTVRLLWVAVAGVIALLASVFFHRFDPARSWKSKQKESAAAVSGLIEGVSVTQAALIAHLSPMPRATRSVSFLRLVASELRLMLRGQHWWWYTIAAGMLVGQVVSPDPNIGRGFLVAAWIWPILLWSQMGCREARYSTSALLFSCERSLSRQLPTLWIAGLLVAMLMGAGVALRFMFAADWHSLVAWLAGALFIPSLALALGAWTNSSKAFEAIYTLWWYVGPAHHTPGLDFMGTTPASSQPITYALAAMILVAAGYWCRRQSLGYA